MTEATAELKLTTEFPGLLKRWNSLSSLQGLAVRQVAERMGLTELAIRLKARRGKVGEQPALYFTHFWAVADARQLATSMRAALDLTNVKR